MYDSRKGLHHGKGKKNRDEAGKKHPHKSRRLTSKNTDSIKARRRLWRLAGIFCMVLVIGSISFILAAQVLAASGGLKIYGVSGDKKGDISSGQDIQQRDTASANIAFTQTEGQEKEELESVEPETADSAAGEWRTSDKLLIIVDAANAGTDSGDTEKIGEKERDAVAGKDINLAVAEKVKTHLETMGYQVLMVRDGSRNAAGEDRARLIKESGADAYIGIGHNFADDRTEKGMEACYGSTDSKESRRLAQVVVQQAVKKTEAAERELQVNEGGSITGENSIKASMPACLLRTGYLSNEEEREKLETEEYQEQAAEGIAQGIDYFFHPKTMYLTFDDGPTEENTSRVLDILKERNIKATFFVVGENVRRHPEVARRIVEEGHTIGIHCDNHAYDVVYESVDSYLQDFENAYETVKEVTGVEVKFFRFPGGSINVYNEKIREEIIEEMTKRGFIYFDWNASLEDAVKKSTPEQLIANGVESTLGRKKVVMLAHDIIYDTGMCLEDLLDRLPEYRMEVLTEDVEPVQFGSP